MLVSFSTARGPYLHICETVNSWHSSVLGVLVGMQATLALVAERVTGRGGGKGTRWELGYNLSQC